MRVLFCTTSGTGHILPMVSTAWALRAAGHDVLFAATESTGVVAAAGLHAVDVAPGVNVGEIFYRHLPALGEYLAQQRKDSRTIDFRPLVPVFADISAALAEGTLRVARAWEPDLLIHTNEQGCGPLAAAALGIPSVVHGITFTTPVAATEALAEAMRYEKYGVTDWVPPAAILDPTPPSLRSEPPDGFPARWSLRCVPYNGGRLLPDWLLEPGERPRVAVTMGTTNPGYTGVDPLRALVECAADVDADFELALGDVDPSPLGTLPANVRVHGWLPLNALLRRCRAIVHHGGTGTVLSAADAGVPQLVLPQGSEQFNAGTALRDRGAGLVCDAADVSADLLRQLLTDEKLRLAAAEVRDELHALPTPAELVPRLESLAG